MKNRFVSLFLILAGLAVSGIHSAALDGVIDFYELYDNPEAHVSLKGKLTTVGIDGEMFGKMCKN